MTDLEHELRKVVEGEVRFDAYSRLLYSTDANPDPPTSSTAVNGTDQPAAPLNAGALACGK